VSEQRTNPPVYNRAGFEQKCLFNNKCDI